VNAARWLRSVAALAGVLLLAGVLAAAAPPDISVEISDERPEVGLVMGVTLTVTGAEGADCTLLELPAVDGARLVFRGGPSNQSSQVNINGRMMRESFVTTWRFELIPQRAGDLLLPPFRLQCRGTEVSSPSRRLHVAESTLQPDLVRLSVRPSAEQLWVGQVLELQIEASLSPGLEEHIQRGGLELDLPWLSGMPGLHAREMPDPPCRTQFLMPVNSGQSEIKICQTQEILGGEQRLVLRSTVPMLATEAGELQLPDSRFGARLVVETRLERDAFSVVFGGRGTAVPTRVVVSEAVAPGGVIRVLPTPEAGRPAIYTNAVGRFLFEGEARPRTLAVGESCTLILQLSTAERTVSNLDLVTWPDYAPVLSDFRLFGKDEDKVQGARTLVFEISPKHDRVSQVPALSFAYFDPEKGAYETATVGPFPLEVRPGGDGGLTELAAPEEVLNDLETIRETLPEPQAPGIPPWTAPGAALLVLLAVELRSRARAWRERHPELLQRRGARGALERALREAGDPASVATAFARYLSARLAGPPAGLTAEEAAERLSDAALAAELVATVDRWEAAYLGGATLDLNEIRGQARALAAKLEAAP